MHPDLRKNQIPLLRIRRKAYPAADPELLAGCCKRWQSSLIICRRLFWADCFGLWVSIGIVEEGDEHGDGRWQGKLVSNFALTWQALCLRGTPDNQTFCLRDAPQNSYPTPQSSKRNKVNCNEFHPHCNIIVIKCWMKHPNWTPPQLF